MNSFNRKLGMILLTVVFIISVQCNRDVNRRKELLIGDWIYIGEQWHPGFRATHDSIFPIFEQDGLLSVEKKFGDIYDLTQEDSLIFGGHHEPNQWGLNREFRGSWKIIKLTKDSLTVKDNHGVMSFYKKSK